MTLLDFSGAKKDGNLEFQDIFSLHLHYNSLLRVIEPKVAEWKAEF